MSYHPPASIASVVREGERLRIGLLDDLRRAESPEGIAAVVTEISMLYGQCFGNVLDAALAQGDYRPDSQDLVTECVCGVVAFAEWKLLDTVIDGGPEYDRMVRHWRKITGMVLTDDDGY